MTINKYTPDNEERGAGTQIPKKDSRMSVRGGRRGFGRASKSWSLLPGEVRELELTSKQGVDADADRVPVHVDSPEEPLVSQKDVSLAACFPLARLFRVGLQRWGGASPPACDEGEIFLHQRCCWRGPARLIRSHGRVHSSRSFKFILQAGKLPAWTILRKNPLESPLLRKWF